MIQGSSHSEAPGSSNFPATDPTDFYMFQSYEPGRSGYTTMIANFNPRHPPFGGPNYYALDTHFYYNIYIDNTGEGTTDIHFQFQFISELAAGGRGLFLNVGKNQKLYVPLKALGPITAGDNSALNFLEYFRATVINSEGSSGPITNSVTGSATFTKPWDNVGSKTFPDYSTYAAQYVYTINIPGCATAGRVYVGQVADPFSINIGLIFDLVNFVPINGAGTAPFPQGIVNDASNNQLRWLNVDSIILEVPTSCLVGSGNGVIGGWIATTSIEGRRQKARLGNPLINELLIGLPDKDVWNRRHPTTDGLFHKYISYPTFPEILNILFLTAVNQLAKANFKTLAPTNFPRTDLQAVYLTGIAGINQLAIPPSGGFIEYLRLNTSIKPTPQANQSYLGVLGGDLAGFPNGRRPGEDIIDITLRAAMGALCGITPYCTTKQASTSTVQYIDGAPVSAIDFPNAFPYVNEPTPGSLYIY